MSFLLSMLPAFIAAFVGNEVFRRRYVKATGERVGFFGYLWLILIDPKKAWQVPPREPFNGRNGWPLVGFEWLLVGAAACFSVDWALTGTDGNAAGGVVTGLVIVALGTWRVKTGRTGETPWRSGPTP